MKTLSKIKQNKQMQHNKLNKQKLQRVCNLTHMLQAYHWLIIVLNSTPIINALNVFQELLISRVYVIQLATSVKLGIKDMETVHNVIKDTFCMKVNALLDKFRSKQLLNQQDHQFLLIKTILQMRPNKQLPKKGLNLFHMLTIASNLTSIINVLNASQEL